MCFVTHHCGRTPITEIEPIFAGLIMEYATATVGVRAHYGSHGAAGMDHKATRSLHALALDQGEVFLVSRPDRSTQDLTVNHLTGLLDGEKMPSGDVRVLRRRLWGDVTLKQHSVVNMLYYSHTHHSPLKVVTGPAPRHSLPLNRKVDGLCYTDYKTRRHHCACHTKQ